MEILIWGMERGWVWGPCLGCQENLIPVAEGGVLGASPGEQNHRTTWRLASVNEICRAGSRSTSSLRLEIRNPEFVE